jgi:hypothetical protein
MFDNETVYFGRDRIEHLVCSSREEAELVKLLSDLQVRGSVPIFSAADGAPKLKEKVEERIIQRF